MHYDLYEVKLRIMRKQVLRLPCHDEGVSGPLPQILAEHVEGGCEVLGFDF
ncbi:MAG: hypothetical protein N3F04_05545 [Candidatus Nezhaarchaeota archaeon]|nr:hypothetical protein [Candidatus Nezhaarchaeota archaeon]